jgi:hypothetical protein
VRGSSPRPFGERPTRGARRVRGSSPRPFGERPTRGARRVRGHATSLPRLPKVRHGPGTGTAT